mmetsp:Transcript_11949/g.18329  ORF Transcript_11949/g.18329 Transcript_11949/m.18329 type:complete len:202 (-) Transcript_11949:1146-1751(-)
MNRIIIHKVVSFYNWYIIPTVHYSFFPTYRFVLLRMVSSHSIDITRKGGIISANEFSAARSYALIQHTKKVGINILQQMFKVIKEVDIVMLSKDIEEASISFVRCNVNCCSISYKVFNISINLVSFNASILILKVTTSNVKSVKNTFLVTMFSCLLTHCCHNSCCRALDFVDITQVIANKAFRPKILFPVFEEEKCIKMYQ